MICPPQPSARITYPTAKQSGWKGPKPPFARAGEERVEVEMTIFERRRYASDSKRGGASPRSAAIRCNTHKWRSIPAPMSASRLTREWLRTAARMAAARADGVAAGSVKASVKARDSGVADRIVSVRPCLKAAVEADS